MDAYIYIQLYYEKMRKLRDAKK